LNAADFFTNATPGNHKPRSTVNHFGGSLGGPILHDKLFFFFDSEWVRIALPIVTATTVPTPAFENYVLEQLPRGGVDSITGSTYQPAPQLVPFYQKLFALYGNTAGTPLAVFWDAHSIAMGPVRPAIRPTETDARIARAFRIRATIASRCRLRASITTSNTNNMAWFRFQSDTGPSGRLHRSHQSDLQCHLSAAPLLLRVRLHARIFRTFGELFQSRVLLV
jgi:hypothetical protein